MLNVMRNVSIQDDHLIKKRVGKQGDDRKKWLIKE